MATNRTCHVCGKRYYYCPTCPDTVSLPRYMVMFDEENCCKIWGILSDRFYGKLTCEEAYQKLTQECDISGYKDFIPEIAKEIEEIIAEHEKTTKNVAVKADTPSVQPQQYRKENGNYSKKNKRRR